MFRQNKIDCDEIEILVSHKWGETWVEKEDWIKFGATHLPENAMPIRAKCSDGRKLRLSSVLPMKYRRRSLLWWVGLKLGIFVDPWMKDTPE